MATLSSNFRLRRSRKATTMVSPCWLRGIRTCQTGRSVVAGLFGEGQVLPDALGGQLPEWTSGFLLLP